MGTGLLDRLHGEGYRTREYVIFGGEWWLYVLNRIAEQPERVLTALADMKPARAPRLERLSQVMGLKPVGASQ